MSATDELLSSLSRHELLMLLRLGGRRTLGAVALSAPEQLAAARSLADRGLAAYRAGSLRWTLTRDGEAVLPAAAELWEASHAHGRQ